MPELVDAIERLCRRQARSRSVLVAITGIDGCGKGYVAARVASALERRKRRVALIGVDRWLNLPGIRFSQVDPAQHFYDHALRLDEMFDTLIRPLRRQRYIHVEAPVVEETDQEFQCGRYEFADVDVILLEGIFLLKRAYQQEYDLSVWIECSAATALSRAIARAQEGLPPDETAAAYHRIYFPAQAIHAELDRPREAASIIFPNDESDEGARFVKTQVFPEAVPGNSRISSSG